MNNPAPADLGERNSHLKIFNLKIWPILQTPLIKKVSVSGLSQSRSRTFWQCALHLVFYSSKIQPKPDFYSDSGSTAKGNRFSLLPQGVAKAPIHKFVHLPTIRTVTFLYAKSAAFLFCTQRAISLKKASCFSLQWQVQLRIVIKFDYFCQAVFQEN